MKLSSLNRRQFVQSMLMLGLTACAGSSLRREAVSATVRARGKQDGDLGPFTEDLIRLFKAMEGGQLDDRELIAAVSKRLEELELDEDVLTDWSSKGPAIPDAGIGYRILHSVPLVFGDRDGVGQAILFFTPPRTSNPAHEHHNLMSTKRVLKGTYHVRQYERLRKVEPGILELRQVTELPRVGLHSSCVEMRDSYRAVHWFGATDEPVLALNINIKNALNPAQTFHGANEPRSAGRYYVDVTGGLADASGSFLAPTITREEAEVFSKKPLSEYPSRLATNARPTELGA